jgi:hypothetical protein
MRFLGLTITRRSPTEASLSPAAVAWLRADVSSGG